MALSKHVKLAGEWLADPLACTAFLDNLIEHFNIIFEETSTPIGEDEEWLATKKRNGARFDDAGNLPQSILLAIRALKLCEQKNPESFRLIDGWQESFRKLGQKILNLSASREAGKAKSNREIALNAAFSDFCTIVTEFKEWIDLTQVALKKKRGTRTKGDQTRTKVLQLHEMGLSGNEIAARIGRSKSTVSGVLKALKKSRSE